MKVLPLSRQSVCHKRGAWQRSPLDSTSFSNMGSALRNHAAGTWVAHCATMPLDPAAAHCGGRSPPARGRSLRRALPRRPGPGPGLLPTLRRLLWWLRRARPPRPLQRLRRARPPRPHAAAATGLARKPCPRPLRRLRLGAAAAAPAPGLARGRAIGPTPQTSFASQPGAPEQLAGRRRAGAH